MCGWVQERGCGEHTDCGFLTGVLQNDVQVGGSQLAREGGREGGSWACHDSLLWGL